MVSYFCRWSFSLSAGYTVKSHLLSRLPLCVCLCVCVCVVCVCVCVCVCERAYWTEIQGRHCATVQLRLNELPVVRKDLRCSGIHLSYL